jgi:hypothetical protein
MSQKNTIASTITVPVSMGTSNYSDNLTILNSGEIAVSTTVVGDPVRALYAPQSQAEIFLTNFGTIIASTPEIATGAIGIELIAPSIIKNYGEVFGTDFGVLMIGGGTVTNIGSISSQGTGLDAAGPAYILNVGLISGTSYGVVENDATLSNDGTINSSGWAVYVDQSSTLINTGKITGLNGVLLASGAYFLDQGAIDVPDFAVYARGELTLALLPGAKFAGDVDDATSEGHIVLGGSSAGSIDLGISFSGFNHITILPGATWQLEADFRYFNNGQTISAFTDLTSGQTISGFTTGDEILLDGFTATSKTYIPGTGAILSNGHTSITLDLVGNFTPDEIIITDALQGTEITAPCFVAGTRIATTSGLRPVEQLKIGDLVQCHDGKSKPIKWIGFRSYNGQLIINNRKVLPICIRQNALSDGVPMRDLFLSPDHSIIENGKLIPAEKLVNGISIFQLTHVETVSYFHIELEHHDIIFADDCPVETFLDADCRGRFHNAADYGKLYPKSNLENIQPCMPRLESGVELDTLQFRLIERALSLFSCCPQGALRGYIDEMSVDVVRGWAQDTEFPDFPLILYVVSNGSPVGMVFANQYREDLRRANLGLGYHGFVFNVPAAFTGMEFCVIRRLNNGVVQELARGADLSREAVCSNAR